MGESFFGLNVALRGLFSAQRNLNTVNHNLNNINTPGYSRQQAIQVASRPMALGRRHGHDGYRGGCHRCPADP
jgi:flagellar hook-associated protein 1 FlgK